MYARGEDAGESVAGQLVVADLQIRLAVHRLHHELVGHLLRGAHPPVHDGVEVARRGDALRSVAVESTGDDEDDEDGENDENYGNSDDDDDDDYDDDDDDDDDNADIFRMMMMLRMMMMMMMMMMLMMMMMMIMMLRMMSR